MASVIDRHNQPVEYGMRLGIYPSNQDSFYVELQRASGSSTGTFTRIALLDPSAGQRSLYFNDILPNDNVTRVYRARHVKDGYTAGAWTSFVSGKPDRIMTMPVDGRPYDHGMDLFVASTAKIQVGSYWNSSYVTKTWFIPYSQLVPRSSTQPWALVAGYLQADGGISTALRQARVPVMLPMGAVMTGCSIRTYRTGTSTSYFVGASLVRVPTTDPANTSNIAILTHPTSQTGWRTVNSSAFTETVSTVNFFDLQVTMNAVAANVTRFALAKVTYRISNLNQTY